MKRKLIATGAAVAAPGAARAGAALARRRNV
jgi:hypothetical protein